MDQQCTGRSLSVFIDHPLFCLLSLMIIGSTVTRCVAEIMEPVNRLAIAAAKKETNKK